MANTPYREVTRMFEGAEIRFRNFAGEERMYNAEGQRNFSLLLTPEEADALLAEGWNVKYLKAREEGDTPQAHLKVKIKLGGKNPPKITLVTSRGKTELPDDLMMVADWAELDSVDLVIRAYDWEVNGNTGRTAYLKKIFLNVREDELDLKYADTPTIGFGGEQLAIEGGEEISIGELMPIEDDDTPF